MKADFNELQATLDYRFKDLSFLEEALIHSSYAYEQGLNRSCGSAQLSNERFEFMGDAVLHLVLTEFLMHKYPSEDEGQLTALRAYCESQTFLAELALKLEIGSFIKFGKGEGSSGGEFKESLLADTMEAIIAAIHYDGGYESAQKFILGHIQNNVEKAHEEALHIDSKSELQVFTQRYFKNMPEYLVISETGPDHEKTFTVSVEVDATNKQYRAEGQGRNKKAAEKEAARLLMELLKVNN